MESSWNLLVRTGALAGLFLADWALMPPPATELSMQTEPVHALCQQRCTREVTRVRHEPGVDGAGAGPDVTRSLSKAHLRIDGPSPTGAACRPELPVAEAGEPCAGARN